MSQQGEIKEKGDKIKRVMLQKQSKGVYFKNGVINGIKFSLEHKKGLKMDNPGSHYQHGQGRGGGGIVTGRLTS